MLKEQKHYNCLKYKIFKPGGQAMVVFYLFLQENILRQSRDLTRNFLICLT